jgi:hypothetical protein
VNAQKPHPNGYVLVNADNQRCSQVCRTSEAADRLRLVTDPTGDINPHVAVAGKRNRARPLRDRATLYPLVDALADSLVGQQRTYPVDEAVLARVYALSELPARNYTYELLLATIRWRESTNQGEG